MSGMEDFDEFADIDIPVVESDAVPPDEMLLLSPGGLRRTEDAELGPHVVPLGGGTVWDTRYAARVVGLGAGL